MKGLFQQVDGLLRGQFTRREDLLEGRVAMRARTMSTAALILGAIYGAFMGVYAIVRADNASVPQLFATMVKVPLLFLLTLVVTLPSLYVFSALANSRLRAQDTLRLLTAAVTVNLALLASFGPVTGFFTLSTDSYPFLLVLNVLFFAISGFAGLAFLRRALKTLFEAPPQAPAMPPPLPEIPADDADVAPPRLAGIVSVPALPPIPSPPAARRPAPPQGDPGRRVFGMWILTYCVVGAQMAWILRPFVGTPGMPFTLFRPRDSNFFEALWHTLQRLFH